MGEEELIRNGDELLKIMGGKEGDLAQQLNTDQISFHLQKISGRKDVWNYQNQLVEFLIDEGLCEFKDNNRYLLRLTNAGKNWWRKGIKDYRKMQEKKQVLPHPNINFNLGNVENQISGSSGSSISKSITKKAQKNPINMIVVITQIFIGILVTVIGGLVVWYITK